jgi:hypothetical protein
MAENRYQESLASIQNTISNCDNKASVLLTAVGVVFGFSMFSTQELVNKSGAIKTLVIIVGALYLLSFLATIVTLVMIVFPRGRNKEERGRQIDSRSYPEDLYKHYKNGDFEDFLSGEDSDEVIVDQIKVCSRIAHTKELLLRLATVSIITFSFLLVFLVVLLIL